MFKNYLQMILISLPILIVLGSGAYFTYDSWEKYNKYNSLKTELNHVKLLQSLEYSVLNEIVCIATMSENKSLMQKVCDPTKKTTDSVMDMILAQKEDPSLYALEKVIVRMRNTVKNSGNVAIEKLVNGDLEKEMSALIKKYKMKLNNNAILESEKAYIQLFSKISDISRATASEKALVSYYLALRKPIPSKNLIYWDKSVSHSELPENTSTHTPYLDTYVQDETFQSLLRDIEDVRIDIMSHASSGHYKYNVAAWVSLITKKQKILNSIEIKLLDHIYSAVQRNNKNTMMRLILSIGAVFLSLLGLWLLFYLWRNKNNKSKFLSQLVTQVSKFNSDDKIENISKNIKSQKMAYEYISSSFETLYDREIKAENDIKSNMLFLNNMSYEIRTPLNGISGYTKLLKETPLNAEQNDYVAVIEDSYKNLDGILKKILNKNNTTSVEKLEIENSTFDIIKKIELAIETYAVKADQKDIVLGIYIDPMLSHKVKGDGTKLSHILTNLVDNALESSNAYDSVNIFVEKLHSDNDLVTIKFSIQDQGIGYTEDELEKIKNAFSNMESNENIPNFDMKNLSISNKIIKRMGGKLELESKKGEGSNFFFVLSFEQDRASNTEVLPTFEGMKVGLALPIVDINRQVDHNLEAYIKHLGATFKVYHYDELFAKNSDIELPELMFFYHNYARLEGELEEFSNLPCKTVLVTSGTLRARINTGKYDFSSIIYSPITMRKVIRTFAESKLNKPIIIEHDTEDVTNAIEPSQEFENIHALVAEDNEISQKILVNILKNFSIEVTVTTDGKKAFDLRREQDFDIIFMDMDMPVMDGYECTSKILYYEGVNQLKHIPIIALGLDELKKDDLTNNKTGIDGFVSKPFESDKIYDIVKKYCIDIPMQLRAQEEDDFIAKVLSEDFLKDDI